MNSLKVKAAFDTFYTIGFICMVIFMTDIVAKWLSISGPLLLVSLLLAGLIYMIYSMRLRQLQFEEKYPETTDKE